MPLVIPAFLLAALVPLHAQASLSSGAPPALPQEAAHQQVGRYVELVVDDHGDDHGDRRAAGLFDLPFNPAVHTIVLFPEVIEYGKVTRGPNLQVDLERQSVCLTERNRGVASSARRDDGAGWAPATEEQRCDAPQIRDFATEGKPIGALEGQHAMLYTKKRRVPKDMQRNLTVFTKSFAIGLMVTAVDDPDDAVALAVVRSRSEVERRQTAYQDYTATWAEQHRARAALELVLHMRATPMQPKTMQGDAAPRAGRLTEVTISNVQGVWAGPKRMIVKLDLENTGTTAFAWAESQVYYGQDRQENHAVATRVLPPAAPAEGLVGRLPPGRRARAAILVDRVEDLSAPMTIVLREAGGGRPVSATVGNWIPMQQPTHRIQMLELRPVEPPDPERGKVSLHLQAIYGAIWLSDGIGLDKSGATSVKGLGLRAQYAFNRWFAFEGEIMGAGTGSARFEDVTFEGMQGALARSASLGRVQLGGVLRFGEGSYVPLVRLGFGGQGASHAAAFNGMDGPDVPFEFSELWYGGAGLELRLGDHFLAGIVLSIEGPMSSDSRSLEAGMRLGYAWHP